MTEEYIEALIKKYAEGIATRQEIQKLMNWYDSATINDVLWQTSIPGEKQDIYNRMLHRLHHNVLSKKAKVKNFGWLKIAAILLVMAGAGFMLLRLSSPSAKSYITVTNLSGKLQLVHLPDSSKVWLNAATELRYAKAFNNSRELELKGEAYFEVVPDASHPFSIKAGGIKTSVLGTSFNIKAYEAESHTSVSVISGSVKVTDKSKNLSVLKPSMQLQYNRQNQSAATSIIDTNSVLAWKKGRLEFEGESLANIASALERWYGIKIIFINQAMRNCRYYMGFDNTIPLDKMLSTMAELTDMQYSIDKTTNIIALSGKGCQ